MPDYDLFKLVSLLYDVVPDILTQTGKVRPHLTRVAGWAWLLVLWLGTCMDGSLNRKRGRETDWIRPAFRTGPPMYSQVGCGVGPALRDDRMMLPGRGGLAMSARCMHCIAESEVSLPAIAMQELGQAVRWLCAHWWGLAAAGKVLHHRLLILTLRRSRTPGPMWMLTPACCCSTTTSQVRYLNAQVHQYHTVRMARTATSKVLAAGNF